MSLCVVVCVCVRVCVRASMRRLGSGSQTDAQAAWLSSLLAPTTASSCGGRRVLSESACFLSLAPYAITITALVLCTRLFCCTNCYRIPCCCYVRDVSPRSPALVTAGVSCRVLGCCITRAHACLCRHRYGSSRGLVSPILGKDGHCADAPGAGGPGSPVSGPVTVLTPLASPPR